MISMYRSPKDTFFYFKTDGGRLPVELSGSWTSEELAKAKLSQYQEGVRNKAEKNSSQVRKAKADGTSANSSAAN
jgi:hypothetical protein